MAITSRMLPRKAVEYKIYRIVIKVNDLVNARFDCAAPDRKAAQDAGDRWCMDRGYTPGWNAHVSVIRKIEDREPATIFVVH